MPLSSPPVTRERLHRRTVTYDGYRRDDGLFDIEGHIRDVKDFDCELLSGMRRAGTPIHDMRVRVTIDRAFVIRAIEAVTDSAPYDGSCATIGPSYTALVGANLLAGFRKRLYETMGGVHGCTHLTELLANLPTAAIQTFASLMREDAGDAMPFQLDRCHALERSTDNVQRYYPRWYRSPAVAGHGPAADRPHVAARDKLALPD